MIAKEIVTMTTTRPREVSSLSFKFFRAGSKFLNVPLFRPNLFIENDSRRRRRRRRRKRVSFHCQASQEVLCHGKVST